MILKSVISLALSVCLFVSPALSQAKRKPAAFDGQAAYEYIKVLASDAMMGRRSGEPGGRMAAEYIVSRLKEWGLEPAGPTGNYYQDLTIEYYEIARDAAFEILDGRRKRDFVYGEDWREQRFSGSGNFVVGIVFAGYGISAAQKGYDDYSGVDVKDKLVLFSTDTPRLLEDKLREEAKFENRIKAAQEHGARGVLTFRAEAREPEQYFDFRPRLKKESFRSDFVILSVESKVVSFIFKHQKADAPYFFQQIETTSKPQSFDMGVRSFVNLNVIFDEKRPTQNVLAKISGTDKNLKNEYVIIGAHMDHLGIDMTGDVFNGADDNASGTAVVMEVARVMKVSRIKPKRTVVFALWAAEEDGLLGSKHYTENPVYPIEKTVVYINLDMEGHGSGKVNFRGVYYAPEIWDILKARLSQEIVENVIPGRGGPGGSDHTHFLSKGVPAYFVATDGSHFKTNRVGDVVELIKPEVLKKAGEFVQAAVEVLAAEPKIPLLARREDNYYWKYQTIVNYETPSLDEVIEKYQDVKDPDVDSQLAAIGEKDGLTGDSLRIEMMKSLLAGQDKIRESKGLMLYGGPGQMTTGRRMRRGGQISKTTVLLGLRGTASFRDDLRWADVFSKQGVAFILLDQPSLLFGDEGLSDEGKKIMESLGKANLLLVVKGLDPGQSKILLEKSKKPLFLTMNRLPDTAVLELVKKTNSALGLSLGQDEEAASYFKRLEEAKKALGTEYLSIVSENCLWSKAGKEQILNLISEMLRAKYESEDLENLFSGAFVRVLDKVRAADKAQPLAFMVF